MKVLPGMRFGRLTVIEQAENQGKHRRWECHCDCGNTKIVSETNLIHNQTRSCGCLARETAKETVKKAHAARRVSFGCIHCGADSHYAKGLCRNCYTKLHRWERSGKSTMPDNVAEIVGSLRANSSECKNVQNRHLNFGCFQQE